VVLSASAQESTKVRALELGADDYITKPFGVPELMARVGAALRRAGTVDEVTKKVYESGKLEIDLISRHVIRDGCEVVLTPTEFRLLKLLVQHEGKVLSHRNILRSVWGPSSVGDRDYLRTYVYKLRRKIEREPEHPVHILSAPGIGYCFVS
jgi:two-component system KDP operon response regulator KdpE